MKMILKLSKWIGINLCLISTLLQGAACQSVKVDEKISAKVYNKVIHLALLTSDRIPDSDKIDDQLLVEALRAYEVEAQLVDWRVPNVNWSDFDAVLVLSTWDYYEDRARFLDLLQNIENSGLKLYNPLSVIQWNSCKKYLRDLEKLGLKTIETAYISPTELKDLKSILVEKGWDECVIKPQVSADGYHTYRFNLSSVEGVQDLLSDYDEEYMVQPFVSEILSEGEWSFVFLNNEYLHCILKKPLQGNFRVQKGTKTLIQPPEWMLNEVKRIAQVVNLPTLQTRIDVIRRGDEIRIMELEMIEPSLYLKHCPGSEKTAAKKIREKLDQAQI